MASPSTALAPRPARAAARAPPQPPAGRPSSGVALTTTSIRRRAPTGSLVPGQQRGPDGRHGHVAVEHPDPRDQVEPPQERRGLRPRGDVGGEGRLELGPVAGQPAADDDELGPGDDEHLHGERDAVRERRDVRARTLVARGGGREQVGGPPGPHPVQRGARGDGLEAALLAARARDAGADRQVPDLARRTARTADDLAPVDDRGRQPGADVEVGRRALGDLRPHGVVCPQRRGLDVVVDAGPPTRWRPRCRPRGRGRRRRG